MHFVLSAFTSVALPVAIATAGIALRIIWARKPSHPGLAFDKVEIQWRGEPSPYTAIFLIKHLLKLKKIF
jgi:hypothetical protein